MSKTVKVTMTAEQKVHISRTVDMDVEDWQEYNRIVDAGGSGVEMDRNINALADKYGLQDEIPHNWEELEDTTFVLETEEV